MRRTIVLLLSIFLIFIAQSTAACAISLSGTVPNLILILVVSVAFFRGNTVGLVTGFLIGLLNDIVFGDVLGFYAMTYMFIGYFCGFAHKEFYDYNLRLPLALIAASDIVYSLVVYGFLFLVRGRLDFIYYLKEIILPEAVYTAAAGIVVYSILYLINRLLTDYERRRDGYFV